MKFERSELGALFSKLRTAVPEVRAVGTDDAGILLSGSNAYATNLELSVRACNTHQQLRDQPRGSDLYQPQQTRALADLIHRFACKAFFSACRAHHIL